MYHTCRSDQNRIFPMLGKGRCSTFLILYRGLYFCGIIMTHIKWCKMTPDLTFCVCSYYRGSGKSLELGGAGTYYVRVLSMRNLPPRNRRGGASIVCMRTIAVSKRIECECMQQQQNMYTSCRHTCSSCFIRGGRG